MAQQMPDMAQIMRLAQQVASQIEPPSELKSGKNLSEEDMSRVIGKITKSVTDIVKPDMFTGEQNVKKNGKQKMPVKPENSKIQFDLSEPGPSSPRKEKKKKVVEIETDSSEDEDPIAPRTKDMTFTVSVTLDEVYSGGKKKIAMRRQKLEPDGSYEDEKKKLSIKIEPGMIDEQTIRFNHMADEKQGYETGDVVVCLDVEEHPFFTRDGNNLIVEKEISFSETFDPVIYIKHLNGKTYTIKGEPFDIFDEENALLKKVKGLGMPVLGEPGIYGDLFIKFTCVNKTKITPEILQQLKNLFPPIETKPDVPDEDIIHAEFEMVTDTDLEFLDFDSDDSDYSETESEEETDEESED
jgi:DnaJ-class molecular chaperone